VDAVTVHFDVAALRDLRDTVAAALVAHDRLNPDRPKDLEPTRARVRLMH
jgi:hypothetical protein